MKLTALDILRGARAKIADPKAWGQGPRAPIGSLPGRSPQTYCAAEAVEEQPHNFSIECGRAINALRNAAGLDDHFGLPQWNDAPEREHRDVLAAFDLAIATLRM